MLYGYRTCLWRQIAGDGSKVIDTDRDLSQELMIPEGRDAKDAKLHYSDDICAAQVQPISSGQHNVSGAQSHEKMIDLFVSTRKSASTQETYLTRSKHFRKFANFKTLQQLTVIDLNEYKLWREKTNNKSATRHNKFMPVESLLTYIRSGYSVGRQQGTIQLSHALKAARTRQRRISSPRFRQAHETWKLVGLGVDTLDTIHSIQSSPINSQEP